MTRWCCVIFKELAACAGMNGMSVIVGRIVNDRFVLQARAADAGIDPSAYLLGSPVKVAVLEERVIFHCPGCGVRLEKFYRRDLESLRRDDLLLDKRHERGS